MQKKTIKRVIEKKMNEWLASITDEELQEEVKKNLLVSGGAIASLFLGEEVNDFDVYLQDMNILKKLAKYYTDRIDGVAVIDGRSVEKDFEEHFERLGIRGIQLRNCKEDQIKLFFEHANGGMKIKMEPVAGIVGCNAMMTTGLYTPVYLSPNAISLTDRIQIVLRFNGTPEKIHQSFDFIHATNYFTFEEGLVTNIPALESLLSKQLKYQGSYYPLTSILRAKKFVKRHWNISAGEQLKIMFQISELDLKNPNVLEEQLIGVDVAYFGILIEMLRAKYEKEPKFKMTSSYLNSLIEKVFGDETEEEI